MYAPEGVTSQYQQPTTMSCQARAYPNSTKIGLTTVNEFQVFTNVTAGTTFTILGPFYNESYFLFEDHGVCSIITSCAVPLVAGDQIGPFKILAGNDCLLPSVADDDWTGSKGINGTSSGSIAGPTSPPSSAISLLPSFEPSSVPSGEPSYTPSSLPSGEPSYIPSDLPSGFPSYIPSDIPSGEPSLATSNLPSLEPSDVPSGFPSYLPSDLPSGFPSTIPSEIPSDEPSIATSFLPSAEPSSVPSGLPSVEPSSVPSSIPSEDPSEAACIAANKVKYQCGEAIDLALNFNFPLIDDWVGIYPCDFIVFDEFQAMIWQWTCGDTPAKCTSAVGSETITFDELPYYNNYYYKFKWPVAPFVKADGSINRCFKAVLLRDTGLDGLVNSQLSQPLCESQPFEIEETAGCLIVR
jgi:hypothetical protein